MISFLAQTGGDFRKALEVARAESRCSSVLERTFGISVLTALKAEPRFRGRLDCQTFTVRLFFVVFVNISCSIVHEKRQFSLCTKLLVLFQLYNSARTKFRLDTFNIFLTVLSWNSIISRRHAIRTISNELLRLVALYFLLHCCPSIIKVAIQSFPECSRSDVLSAGSSNTYRRARYRQRRRW